MDAYAIEWLQLLFRWVHLITCIAWIGAAFYFVFLDNSLRPTARLADAEAGVGGELWAVHGGGFYHVRKFRLAPDTLPEPLHWFRWEAYWTWLSGFALLVVLDYLHAQTYMIDRNVADLAAPQAIAISIGLIVGGWLFYDQLCRRLGLLHEPLLALCMVAFVVLVAWMLSHLFSGRAMFLQVGAMLGTIMAWNVFFVIIPGQRMLVQAKVRGEAPDPVYGLRGKQRSVHNNYFTLPVLFLMISGHYPMLFGGPHAWLVLVAILLLAAFVRHFFNLRHKGKTVWAIPVTAAVAALVLAFALAPRTPAAVSDYRFADVQAIIAARCAPCHAEQPTHPGFVVAPKGFLLDRPERIRAGAAGINEQAVLTRAMPIGNLTRMTDAERATLAAWIHAGAPAH